MKDNIGETIEAFELLKQQGKIKYYGILHSSARNTGICEPVEHHKRNDPI